MNQSRDIDRRTVVTGAAWTIPVIAAAAATPLAAASTPCVPQANLSTLNASFVRAGTGSAYYQWQNVFRQGDELRLNVTAQKTSTGLGSIAANNLALDTAPTGSTFGLVAGATSALNLQVAADQEWLEVAYEFSFSYAASGGAQQSYTGATNNVFRITDIDGLVIDTGVGGSKGAERVSVISGATGTINNSAYLLGSGTFNDPWARQSGSNPAESNIGTYSSGAGNIVVTAPASTWSLRFRANNLTNATNPSLYNLWVTPINFLATNPTPC